MFLRRAKPTKRSYLHIEHVVEAAVAEAVESVARVASNETEDASGSADAAGEGQGFQDRGSNDGGSREGGSHAGAQGAQGAAAAQGVAAAPSGPAESSVAKSRHRLAVSLDGQTFAAGTAPTEIAARFELME